MKTAWRNRQPNYGTDGIIPGRLSMRGFAAGIGGNAERVALTDVGANQDWQALHIAQALTNLSIGYHNAAMVAEMVYPVVPSDYPQDKYWQFGFEEFSSVNDNYVPGAQPGEVVWAATTASFECNGHGIRSWYPAQVASAADAVIDPDIHSVRLVSNVIELVQEINLVNLLTGGACPNVDMSANGGTNQFTNPDFDPVTYFDQQKEVIAAAIGRAPNTMVLGRKAYRGMRNNYNLLRRAVGAGVDINLAPRTLLGIPQLQEQLDIQNIIVAEGMYNTAQPGQAVSLSYIWGNMVLLFYKPPAPGKEEVALGYTFRWNFNSTGNQALIQGGGQGGQYVNKWFDQDRERQVIDCKKFYTQQTVASGAGILYNNTTNN